MTTHVEDGGDAGGNLWRIAGWGAVALVLLAPLVAMQFTDEVNWTTGDFVFAAVVLGTVGGLLELTVRKTGDAAYRAAVGAALIGGLLLVWLTGAVGIIGSEDNPANLMYGGVLAIGIIGALIARFRARGMARAMSATALATVAVAVIAYAAGMSTPGEWLRELVFLNGLFAALFAGSAVLFREAANGRVAAGDG